MLPRNINVGVTFDAFSVEVNIPLDGAGEWFRGLQERNEISRARDRGEHAPSLVYRDVCPGCGAGATALTALDEPEGRVRACVLCGGTFSPGVDE